MIRSVSWGQGRSRRRTPSRWRKSRMPRSPGSTTWCRSGPSIWPRCTVPQPSRDLDALLGAVDAIYVCTMPQFHREAVERAAAVGRPRVL